MNEICLNPAYSTTRRVFKVGGNVPAPLSLPSSERRIEGGLRVKGYRKIGQKHLSKTRSNSATEFQCRPLISIITVVLNARDVIVRTIESVLHQSYENIEYIIVDGGSTDGTADALRKYDDFIDYWISEPDSGLYAASNKAISLMLGDAHQFLNAGDYLDGDVFSKEPIIPSLAIVYFNGVQGGVRKARLRNSKHGMPYCREGILFESKGILYNEKYRVAADYQYYLDHGYERPPPKGNGSGSVVVSFGFSRKLYWQGYMESSRIVLRAFGPLHFSWCCLTGIVKGLVKSILRSTM